MSTLSERLIKAAQIRGVTQAWIAAEANTSTANVSRYFQGKQAPAALDIMANISKALNISADYLLGITDSPFSNEPSNQVDAELLSCYLRASDADKQVVWALLKKYVLDSELEQLDDKVKKEIGL